MSQSQPEESVPFGPPAPARESTYEEARRALDGDLRANFMVGVRNRIRQNQQINNSGPAAPSGPSVPTSMSDDNVLTKKTPETPAIPKKRAGLRSDTNITSPSKIPRQVITSAALVPPILTEESVTFKPPAFTKKKSKIRRKENTDDTLQQAKTAIKNKPARRTKSSRRKTKSYLSMTARSPKDIQITTPHVHDEIEDFFEPELFASQVEEEEIGDDNTTYNQIEQDSATGLVTTIT